MSAGRCAICGAPVVVGAPALFSAAERAIAHAECGGRS